MILRRILPAYLSFILFFSTACKKTSEETQDTGYCLNGDTVHIYNEDLFTKRIKVVSVKRIPWSKEVMTAGTVQAIPIRFAYIASPFSGRVTKSHVELGQKIKTGIPLFEIISPDFTNAQKEFFQAQSERDLAQKDLARKEDLIRNGISSQKELEEALNALKIAEKEYENAYEAIKIFQMDPERMILGQPLIVKSPITGEVIENNIITGQFLSSEAEPVAIVADLSQVWITAQVKEKDIRFIQQGDEMQIHVSALPGETIFGKVFHIDEQVDEDTRSIRVLSLCENEKGLLKLGMYATVNFIVKMEEKVVIPEKSLLQDETDSFVFVQVKPGVFLKRAVTVETTTGEEAVIAGGLQENEMIISEGGYYFK